MSARSSSLSDLSFVSGAGVPAGLRREAAEFSGSTKTPARRPVPLVFHGPVHGASEVI